MASIATTREKSRARTSVTSQSTVWSIEAESGSGAVFRPERSFMMKAPKWVRFEDRHSILNSAIHPELGSSAAVTDPRHPYALTRLSKRVRESGPNLLAGKLILVEQIGGNVAHVT